MAIYRPPKARWPLALAAVIGGFLFGLVTGLLLSSDPAPADVASDVRAKLVEAATVLDVVPVEYEEGVEGDEIVAEREYEAAGDALDRSRARYEEVEAAVEALAPERAGDLAAAYDEVARMIDEVEDPAAVEAALERLQEELRG